MEELPREADVVVVGAGALGSSVAFHLAARGDRRVVLIDKFAAASQTSPRAAGLTQQLRATEPMAHLARRACDLIESFQADTGQPMEFHRSGSVKLARLPEHVEQLEAELERAGRWGLRLGRLEPSELPKLSPFVRPDGVLFATHNPDDLYLEPGQIPRGYARAAVDRGASLVEHTPVRRLLLANDRVAGVETPRGEIRAPLVVDAAGAWTRPIAETGGARPALVPTRHQLLITQPLDGVRPEQPIVRVVDANVYVRPERGGLMLGGYEDDPRQYDGASLGDGFQIADLELDLGVLRRLADRVVAQLPVFQDVFARGLIREHRGGLPTVTPDGRLLVGPLGAVPGLYVASGCNVGGLSTAPAIGEALAELIALGRTRLDLSELWPDRFGPEYGDQVRLRAACQREYAYQYWTAKPTTSAPSESPARPR
ncbi:MAG TPA: FAD-binding oxidoreductase [Chloroflexota bacterium]|jgi:4-methylaminobutanoate oxidase (formaldehyde-forming)